MTYLMDIIWCAHLWTVFCWRPFNHSIDSFYDIFCIWSPQKPWKRFPSVSITRKSFLLTVTYTVQCRALLFWPIVKFTFNLPFYCEDCGIFIREMKIQHVLLLGLHYKVHIKVITIFFSVFRFVSIDSCARVFFYRLAYRESHSHVWCSGIRCFFAVVFAFYSFS